MYIIKMETRVQNFIGFCVCLLMMGYALYAEYVLLLAPCPLCVLQRIAVSTAGLFFLIACIHNSQSISKIIYTSLIGLSSLTGSSIAAWHIYLQNLPIDKVPSCGPGFDYLIGNFPLGEALLIIFSGSGECATVDWSFLNLSMPTWVLIGCIGIFIFNLMIYKSSTN